jgi:2-polyprenyl-3-methyl-5-hydroxy-6-metoxy-1,4-benzoquinol methylase
MPYSRCGNCGFTFANPVPPDELLSVYYNSTFYRNYRCLEYNRIPRDRFYSISMYTDPHRLARWLGDDRAISILDYGCGPGAFLALLRENYGFSALEGLELNRQSVEIARKHFGFTLAKSPQELKQPAYDCVTLLEVIEHIPDPSSFFRHISELVKPGGRVLITTPAVDNLLGRFYPRLCIHYTAPSHVSLFTRQAMELWLSRFEFEIERIEMDHTIEFLETAPLGLLYDLDFLGPQHDDDSPDFLYCPNAIGRILGLRPRRTEPAYPFKGVLARMNRLLYKIARHLRPVPRNTHLYVLARKCSSKRAAA